MSEDMQLLRELPLFADIPDEVIEELTPLLKDQRVESGTILCEQGLFGTQISIVQSGQVRISITGDDDREQVLGFLGPGDPIGEMSVLSGERMSANVIATVDTQLKTIDGETFLAFCDKHPILYRRLLKILAERVRTGNRRRFTARRGRVGWFVSGLQKYSPVVLNRVLAGLARLFSEETQTRPLLMVATSLERADDENTEASQGLIPKDAQVVQRGSDDNFFAEITELNSDFLQEWSCIDDSWEILGLRQVQKISQDRVIGTVDECIEELRPSFSYILAHHRERPLELLLKDRLPDDNVVVVIDLISAERQRSASRKDYDSFVPEPHRYPPEPDTNYWVLEPNTLKELESLAEFVRNKGRIEVVLVHRIERSILDYSRIRKLFKGHSVHCFPVDGEGESAANEKLQGLSYSLALGKAPAIAKKRIVRELAHTQVGLALGGGGARGLAHIGVIKTLEEEGIPIDLIAGSSMGGIVAAVYAQGRPGPRLLADTRHYWSNLGNFLFDILDYSFPRTNLLRGRKIKQIIKSAMEGVTIEECQIPLVLACTDLLTAKQVVLEEGNLGEAIVATGALPGIFRPVRWGKHLLVDGAVIDKVPAQALQNMGARFIISVNVTPDYDPNLETSGINSQTGLRKTLNRFPPFKKWSQEPNILQVISRSLGISGIHQARAQVDLIDVEIKPKVEQFDFLRFDRYDQIVEAGVVAAREAIPEIRNLIESVKFRE
jgi:predicted acylesterase/phospholipase RssA/CRP-like cAMP-binding protein